MSLWLSLLLMTGVQGDILPMIPVTLKMDATPDKRVKLRYFSVYLIPLETERYAKENPSLDNPVSFDESRFKRRRYKLKEHYSATNKAGGDYEHPFQMELRGGTEYMLYLFFEESSWEYAGGKRRLSRNKHYIVQDISIEADEQLKIDLDLHAIDLQAEVDVHCDIYTVPAELKD